MNAVLLRCGLQGARVRYALALAMVLSAWTTVKAGEMILIDDFNDGNDDGWTHVDLNSGQPWGPTIFDASSGAYHLSTPGDVPVGAGGAAASFWDQSSDPMFSNGFVRAKVRTGNEGSLASIFFRTTVDLATGVDGYLFFASAGNTSDRPATFLINTLEDSQIARVAAIPANMDFGVDEDWWIEAGGVGHILSMKVWRDGDPEPRAPQLTFPDKSFSTGLIGVESNIFASPAFPEPIPLDATFDDISFVLPDLPPGIDPGNVPPGLEDGLPRLFVQSVPEPSSLLLAGAGLAALIYGRRGRGAIAPSG